MPTERNEPLRLRTVKVNGQYVSNKQKFDADGNWLEDLTIHVKNVSDKRILFASIDLFFRSSEKGGPHALDQAEYGNHKLLTMSLTAADLAAAIEPGAEVDIRLNGIAYDRVSSLLAAVGLTDVARLKIRIGRVIFDDDTSWYAGSYFQRDASEARFWNNIDDKRQGKKPLTKGLSARTFHKDQSAKSSNLALKRSDPLASWTSLLPSNAGTQLNEILMPISYHTPLTPPTTCYRVMTPNYVWCNLQPGCTHRKDTTDMQPGNYVIQSEQTSCNDNILGNFCGLDTTTVGIQCVFGGGGGGGSGGGGTEGSCMFDDECDFGFKCVNGQCSDDFVPEDDPEY